MTDKIIVLPEYEALVEEVKKLRMEAPILLQERDTLLAIECPNIKMKYMLHVGGLECRAFQEECRCHRSKRKIELMRAKINRREKVEMKAIEHMLDEEFAEFKEMMEQKIHELNLMAERSKGAFLSEKETEEFKKMYYRIVKILHPDLHPDLSDEEKILFFRAVEAYENGDMLTMKMINESIMDPQDIDNENSMSKLEHDKKSLGEMIISVKADITKIKSSFPYDMKEKVEDKTWIAQKKEELQDIIDSYKEQNRQYMMQIKEMERG